MSRPAEAETFVSPWRVRFAQLLVEYVYATDLQRLSTAELNRLNFRFDWFLVLPESGRQAIIEIDGLRARESPDVFAVEGDTELTLALNAAVRHISAEVARRLPQDEVEDFRAWSQAAHARFARKRVLRDSLKHRDADVPAVLLVRSRNREQRPQSRARVACGSRDPPSGSSEDDPPDPACRAVARLSLVPCPEAAR